MAASGGGKKGKKKKGITLNINDFLKGDDSNKTFIPPRKTNWADIDNDYSEHVELAEEYGGPPRSAKPAFDITKLPSAPRASLGVEIDLSRLPNKPPYTAFLGNLPFDVTENDIKDLFRGLKVENIRFPLDNGRMKGFGYAEFNDIDQLKQAIALTNEKIRNRQIRIDIADAAGKDSMGKGSYQNDDKTGGDWRRDFAATNGQPPMNGDRGFRDVRGNDVARKEGGFRHQEASGADLDDKWRRDDPPPPISYSGRDKPSGGFRESRNQDTWRAPRDDSTSGGYKNDYDFRGPPRDYGPPREGRGGAYGGGGGGGGGYRDSREGFKNDGRGGTWRNKDTRDEQSSEDVPKERPKLLLQPKSVTEASSNESSKKTSIFGNARPVDTTAKEKLIEEKLSQMQVPDRRRDDKIPQRSRSPDGIRSPRRASPRRTSPRQYSPKRDGSRERDHRHTYKDREESKKEEPLGEADTANDWRDESLRPKARVMKPAKESDGSRDKRGGGGGGRGKNAGDKKKINDTPIIPQKYEEPAKPIFGQTSKFAALDVEENGNSENEEEN